MISHMLKAGIACYGLGFSSESVERIRRTFQGHPLFLGALEAKGLPVPVEEDSVDAVLLVEVIEHLLTAEFMPTLREIHRILRPGGHAIVTVPNEEDLDSGKVMCPECWCIFHRWQHQRSFTAGTLAETMEKSGLTTVTCLGTAFDAPSWRTWARRFYAGLRGGPVAAPCLVYIGEKGGSERFVPDGPRR